MRLTSALVAAAGAAGLYVWLTHGPSAEGASPPAEPAAAAQPAAKAGPEPVRVIAVHSSAQRLSNELTLRGVTEAARKVEVKAQTGGLVSSEPILKGAEVKAGDLLCRIEQGERPAQLAEAQAKLLQAEADATASATLSKKGYSSETAVAADAAALEAAKAAVEKVKVDIARTEITAPFAGVLETNTAELGELLQAGSVCATVVALDPIHFVGFASEGDVGKIRADAEATARLIDGAEVEATVTFVARSSDPETRTYRVEATAPNPGGKVRDGLTAEIRVALEDDLAHLAPHSALTLNDAGVLGVRLVEDGVARFQPVRILRDDERGVWLAGLPEKADVIVVGQEFVTDGAPVEPTFR